MQRFPDDVGLRGVIGATVDAWTVYRIASSHSGPRATLSRAQGIASVAPEYRSLTITLSALAGELSANRDGDINPHDALNAALAEGRADK